jgi:hypothetical protein
MVSWFGFWESKGISQETTGIIGPIIVETTSTGTTSPETINIGITVHEIVLNKIIEIGRMISGRI